nr:immunoglobulin light chain junction region [Macaca mulatta]MOW04315.1 immunoglobulin light chain junction region [Macaca mulatta]MOW04555.1 immunoglobulin light chain junction region [Macaca mulatta]MOW04911.1 immunoglobulin light chain junction region [Macaca mulatta]MOW05003.1 immunoglobulin light chain junction region [Macaca mulatta]
EYYCWLHFSGYWVF